MKTETIRQKKIADQIKNQIGQIIDRKLKDPRKGMITITYVKVTGDLRIANVYFTALGDEEQRNKSQQTLESANGFLRNELSPFLKMRFTPELRFFYDESLDYSQHINELIKQIHLTDSEKEQSGS
jgi:ribosome-binding factor A